MWGGRRVLKCSKFVELLMIVREGKLQNTNKLTNMMALMNAVSSTGQCVWSSVKHPMARTEYQHRCCAKKLVGSSPSTEFHLKAISNDLMIQLLRYFIAIYLRQLSVFLVLVCCREYSGMTGFARLQVSESGAVIVLFVVCITTRTSHCCCGFSFICCVFSNHRWYRRLHHRTCIESYLSS